MREALAFLGFDLRTRVRGRGTLLGVLLALGALALALTVARGDGGALATSWYPWVLGALGFAWAAGSASVLPGDRSEGRAAWIATLAARPVARRLGAASAGALLALAASLTGALLVGLLAPALGVARTLRTSEELPLPEVRRFLDPSGRGLRTLTLEVGERGAAEPGRLLEADVRPLLLSHRVGAADVAEGALRLGWVSTTAAGTLDVPLSGRLRLPLAPADRTLRLSLEGGAADLVLRAARVLGGERPFLSSACVLGLLLGLAAAALAPFAVAVSRLTSAPVAALAALLLVALAGMRALLPDLSALPAEGALQGLARAVVGVGVRLAPDLSALARAAEPAGGRALPLGALAGLLPVLPHALGYLVLLLLPARPGAPVEGRA